MLINATVVHPGIVGVSMGRVVGVTVVADSVVGESVISEVVAGFVGSLVGGSVVTVGSLT